MAKLGFFAGVLALAVILGCESKPTEKVPTTPPLAPAEAHLVLKNLQYVGLRKDLKHIPILAPVNPDIVFGSAWWFHQHAGKMGIALDEKELVDLDMLEFLNMGYISTQPLKDFPAGENKIDNFPAKSATYDISKARKVYNAGLYRLLKGVPPDMWGDLVVMENKPDTSNVKLRQLTFGYKGTPVMIVAALEREDGKWAVTYIQFKKWPEELKKMVQAS
ncbi:MAG: hypothetical protein HY823_03420 [Acidobacteria bacterium]|nr:hypothetical protein [Acidobacteriota bacterium]